MPFVPCGCYRFCDAGSGVRGDGTCPSHPSPCLVAVQFYGICVSSCPSALTVVCNDDSDIQAALIAPGSQYNQQTMLDCLNNTSPDPPGVQCSVVKQKCWVTPVDTTSSTCSVGLAGGAAFARVWLVSEALDMHWLMYGGDAVAMGRGTEQRGVAIRHVCVIHARSEHTPQVILCLLFGAVLSRFLSSSNQTCWGCQGMRVPIF